MVRLCRTDLRGILPVKSPGVLGGGRTYGYVVARRAIEEVQNGAEPLFVERGALADMATIQALLPRSVPVPGDWWKEALAKL